MSEELIHRKFRNLKGRLRSLLLASVRSPRLIAMESLKDPEKTNFATFRDLVNSENLRAGDHIFFPFTGSGVVKFQDGSEFGIDAEHREIEVRSNSEGFHIRLYNSVRFGRLTPFDAHFPAGIFHVDKAMIELYYRIKAIVEVSEEFDDLEVAEKIESVIDQFPDLKISLLSYLVHRDELGDRYEMDDLFRKLPFIAEESFGEIDHSFIHTIEETLEGIEKKVNEDHIVAIKTRVIPIGHSHIDLAWLWPISETIEKDHRSFSTMTYLLKQNEFAFVQSMAWHYKLMEQNYPDLFEEIKSRISEGKWIPIGGMMVESDCNLISGESLVRQILYGQTYFKEHFGKISNLCWLPDTFGFPAQLPQILSKSGFDLFVTTKMSWNDTEEFPHDTFNWISPDGSTIISHSHTRTYNSKTDFRSVMKTIMENKISSETVGLVPLIYGYGDGGGGPNMNMIQEIKSLQGLTGIFSIEPDPLNHWISWLKSVQNSLPSYAGSLYLQYHRGTYTTHGDIKSMNRIIEGKLFNAEAMFCVLNNKGRSGSFRNEWEILLKNQFHDILPGSSINQVYTDAVSELENLEKQLERSMRDAMDHFASREEEISIFSPYPFSTSAWVKLDHGNYSGKIALSEKGEKYTIISYGNVTGFYAEFDAGLGFYNYSLVKDDPRTKEAVSKITLNNNRTWVVEISNERAFATNRIGKNIPLPEFRIFNDFPGDFDAWELDDHRRENGLELVPSSIERRDIGGYGIIVEENFKLNPGSMTVDFHFPDNDEFAELVFNIDWRGNNRLLRMYIPVKGKEVFGEQPYYYGKKPDDRAAFEFPMHRVVSVDDKGDTFVILNRTKYGYSMEQGFLGVTLLRSPAYPDPLADRGKNEFSFRLGFLTNPTKNQLINEGIRYNVLPEVYHGVKASDNSFIKIEGAVIGSLKKAENSQNVILRLINYDDQEREFEILMPWDIEGVMELNLLESSFPNSNRNLICKGRELKGSIMPHEIVSLEVTQQYVSS